MKTESKDEIIKVKGAEPSKDELDWLNYGRESLQESSKVLDDAAKAFVTLESSLLTVYTGSLTLFKIPEKNILPLWLMYIPLLIWILSIIGTAMVYFPGKYEAAKNCITDLMQLPALINKKKYERLRIGIGLFVLALIATSSVLIYSSAYTYSPKVVQFTASGENIPLFQNMSISFQKDTQRTEIVTLVDATDKSYKVQLSDGRIVEFNKDLVKGIIYQER